MNTEPIAKNVIESAAKGVIESVSAKGIESSKHVIESVAKLPLDAASEIVDQVVEQAVAKAPKKETWISTLFRWFSYIFVFWIGILVV
jgi:trans-2-enoyl-CoA reductase